MSNLENLPSLSGVSGTIEKSRRTIALIVICSFVSFVGAIVLYSIFSSDDNSFQNGKDLISILGSTFGGLCGAVVGFYFGSESKQ